MTLYELSKLSERCNAINGFSFVPKESMKLFATKAHAITEYAKSLALGVDKDEALAVLNTQFDSMSFPVAETRKIELEKAVKLVDRYIKWEQQIPGKRIECEAAYVDVGLGEEISVAPDFIRLDGTELTVVKLHAGKIPSISGDKNNPVKYAMLKYGRLFVSPGTHVTITAQDVYLSSRDDRGVNITENYQERSNSTSVSERYVGGDSTTTMDSFFSEILLESAKGRDKDSMNASDCAMCKYNEFCHYAEPPLKNKIILSAPKILSAIRLSKEQRLVIGNRDHNVLIRCNSCAGSGKTTLVALRVISLINRGVKPEEILLVTFTNAGCKEMRDRIALYRDDMDMDFDVNKITVLTFNSFGYEIVKKEFAQFGFSAPPTVIDDVERAEIIQNKLRDNPIPGLDYEHFYDETPYVCGALPYLSKAFDIIKRYSLTRGDEPKLMTELSHSIRSSYNRSNVTGNTVASAIFDMYDEYDYLLRSCNLVELSDQEAMLEEILFRNPNYFESFGFKHIIVDEFQDTDSRELRLLKAFMECPSFVSMLVVGDDSQSIFGSIRGTSPENIIDLDKKLGDMKINRVDVTLTDNYRCTPEVIDLANKIINRNFQSSHKMIHAARSSGKPVFVQGFKTVDEEHAYIIAGITEKITSGVKPEDIAVLCYTRSELSDIASGLAQMGITSNILSEEPYLKNSAVIACIALVKLLSGDESSKNLMLYANAMNNGCFIKANETEIEVMLERARENVSDIENTEAMNEKKDKLLGYLTQLDINEDEIYESFLEKLKRRSYEEILVYCSKVDRFGGNYGVRRNSIYSGVSLMTCHGSKGLEFPVVYLSVSKFNSKNIEEMRRLLFVSMTRARDELYVTGKYVESGTKKNYTFNRALVESYESVGKDFIADVKTIL